MRRGEIWTVAGGVFASKPRPAVIVKSDQFAALNVVAVCPMTSESTVEIPLLRLPIEPSAANGLRESSHIMVDRITTVRTTSLGSRTGELTNADLLRVERELLLFLGIAG